MATLLLPRLLARNLADLFARSSRIYGRPVLTLPDPDYSRWLSPVSTALEGVVRGSGVATFRRTLPLFGKYALPIGYEPVEIPDTLELRFSHDQAVISRFPVLPALRLRPVAHRGDTRFPVLGRGAYLMQAARPNVREPNTMRHDTKNHTSGTGYREGIWLPSRVLRSPADYLSVNDSFRLSQGDPWKFMRRQAIIDAARNWDPDLDAYARLADTGYWPFPGGHAELTRLWN